MKYLAHLKVLTIVAAVVSIYLSNQLTIEPIIASRIQSSTECYSFDTVIDACGEGGPQGCGIGTYNITGQHVTGAGRKRSEPRSVPCIGTDCSQVTSVPTAVDNPLCCDRDQDNYNGSVCGGSDCNDENSAINPGATEICNDGIENDCNTQTTDTQNCCPEYRLYNCIEELPPPECPYGIDWDHISCQSPVMVDVEGNGLHLTAATSGVLFDLNASGTPRRVAWTEVGSDDAWLSLDRNGNGLVDNGTELFGNFTPQPTPPGGEQKNGFLALAEFDNPTSGGNGDGAITPSDNAFASLRLWQDKNHDGISESTELHTLTSVNVESLSLDYRESRRRDRYGNVFRYRAKVKDTVGGHLGRWAWDVFLVSSP